jgi:hypothetical protein
MAVRIQITGSPGQSFNTLAAPAANAGEIIGGEFGGSQYGGNINITDRLRIVDPTPGNAGYWPFFGSPPSPQHKFSLILSPSERMFQERATARTGLFNGLAATYQIANFSSYNNFHPSTLASYVASRHMAFYGMPSSPSNPNSLNIYPISTNPAGYWTPGNPWDSPSVFPNWTQLGTIQWNYPGVTQYTSISDYRFKENITPIENGLNYILSLRPRHFTWKESGIKSLGFIAHEIQEDVPLDLSSAVVSGQRDDKNILVNLYLNDELMLDENEETIVRTLPQGMEADKFNLDGITWKIVSDENSIQTIDTNFIISPLISSVQELKKMFDVQKNKLDLIEKDIVEMELM